MKNKPISIIIGIVIVVLLVFGITIFSQPNIFKSDYYVQIHNGYDEQTNQYYYYIYEDEYIVLEEPREENLLVRDYSSEPFILYIKTNNLTQVFKFASVNVTTAYRTSESSALYVNAKDLNGIIIDVGGAIPND